ncbi:MAG: hypothetical protein NT106_14640, partial [Candidatus Sumerlaeota bacterium]|nr:hypothetical protein [Candidatus Sumerlaeota bacterium]
FEAIREVLLLRGERLPAQKEIEVQEILPAPSQKEKQANAIDSVPAVAFILTHVFVMGVAGILFGAIAGIYFIGVSWKAKMWPGMIMLMATSLFGAALRLGTI